MIDLIRETRGLYLWPAESAGPSVMVCLTCGKVVWEDIELPLTDAWEWSGGLVRPIVSVLGVQGVLIQLAPQGFCWRPLEYHRVTGALMSTIEIIASQPRNPSLSDPLEWARELSVPECLEEPPDGRMVVILYGAWNELVDDFGLLLNQTALSLSYIDYAADAKQQEVLCECPSAEHGATKLILQSCWRVTPQERAAGTLVWESLLAGGLGSYLHYHLHIRLAQLYSIMSASCLRLSLVGIECRSSPSKLRLVPVYATRALEELSNGHMDRRYIEFGKAHALRMLITSQHDAAAAAHLALRVIGCDVSPTNLAEHVSTLNRDVLIAFAQDAVITQATVPPTVDAGVRCR